jgi:hypothetical protein
MVEDKNRMEELLVVGVEVVAAVAVVVISKEKFCMIQAMNPHLYDNLKHVLDIKHQRQQKIKYRILLI